jgi:hypothetical protein
MQRCHRAVHADAEGALYLASSVRDLDEARTIIGTFIERDNHQWLIGRLDHRPPAIARRDMLARAA